MWKMFTRYGKNRWSKHNSFLDLGKGQMLLYLIKFSLKYFSRPQRVEFAKNHISLLYQF